MNKPANIAAAFGGCVLVVYGCSFGVDSEI
jgi:hypothetical protein